MRVEIENMVGLDLGYIEFPDGVVPRVGDLIRHQSSSTDGDVMDSVVERVTWLTRDSALYGARVVVNALP